MAKRKNKNINKGILGQHNTYNRRIREQEIENLSEVIMTETFFNLVKEKDPCPGISENYKQDKPKETHTKTHSN